MKQHNLYIKIVDQNTNMQHIGGRCAGRDPFLDCSFVNIYDQFDTF